MKKFLSISRPRFWIYVAGPFWLCAALLYPFTTDIISFLVMLVYFTFPANILIYGVNDIYDREIDLANAKKQGYESVHDVAYTKKLWLIIFLTNIPFVLYAYLILPQVAYLSLFIFILLAWQYSAKPLRAKTIPFIDSFVSALLYIVPASVAWGIVLGAVPHFIPMLAAFLWAYAMHMYSAIPDITADTLGGIKTSATILGKNYALFVCSMLYISAALLIYSYIGIVALFGAVTYLVFMYLSYKKRTPDEVLLVYRLFPYINTCIGAVLFFTLLF